MLSVLRKNSCKLLQVRSPKVFFSIDIEAEVKAANERSSGDWILQQTPDKGWGIVAVKDIAPSKVLFRARALEKPESRTAHSVQTDWNSFVHMDLPARFINHSCDANVGILDNEFGAFDYIALKKISCGEELTWDYGATEYEVNFMDKCLCGSPKCRGKRISFKESAEIIRQQYGKHYGKYLHNC